MLLTSAETTSPAGTRSPVQRLFRSPGDDVGSGHDLSVLGTAANFKQMLATLKTGSAEAFPAMEAVSLPPAGGSASRSRANKSKGLPARLSGAGMEKSE